MQSTTVKLVNFNYNDCAIKSRALGGQAFEVAICREPNPLRLVAQACMIQLIVVQIVLPSLREEFAGENKALLKISTCSNRAVRQI